MQIKTTRTVLLSVSFIACLFFSQVSFSQIFQRTYGTTDDDGNAGNTGIPYLGKTSEGGYIIAGTAWDYVITGGSRDAYVVKTDASGSHLWSKYYGGSGNDYSTDIKQTNDGGYILSGYYSNTNQAWLVKTTSNGSVSWTKTFVGTNGCYFRHVQQTVDGGYIAVGRTVEFGAGSSDVYLVKTTSSGVLSWTKTYGTTDVDNGYSVIQTSDGGYVIAGQTKSTADMFLMKTSSDGSLGWSATYGTANTDVAYFVKQTNDGGFILSGYTFLGGSNFHMLLAKTTSDGTLSWSKDYGGTGSDIGYEAQQTADGGYIFTGYGNSFGAGGNDAYLVKTTSDGTLSWSKTYGGTGGDRSFSVQQTADGGYVFGGLTASFGAGSVDVYLVKTNATGSSGCSETSPSMSTGTGITQGAITFTESSGGTEGSGGASGNPTTTSTTVCITLPVELLSFSATCEQNKIRINWQTASEQNNDFFTVERAGSPALMGEEMKWQEIGKVKGAGNSSVIRNYQFIDSLYYEMGNNEDLYYRLKQTDYDGGSEYFSALSLRCAHSEVWDLILQSFSINNNLLGTLILPEEMNVSLEIVDLLGKIVKQETLHGVEGANMLCMDVSGHGRGIYFITVNSKYGRITEKVRI